MCTNALSRHQRIQPCRALIALYRPPKRCRMVSSWPLAIPKLFHKTRNAPFHIGSPSNAFRVSTTSEAVLNAYNLLNTLSMVARPRSTDSARPCFLRMGTIFWLYEVSNSVIRSGATQKERRARVGFADQDWLERSNRQAPTHPPTQMLRRAGMLRSPGRMVA